MFELLQKLIAFKYSCKLNHWTTNEYSMHLLFDRLQEDMDDIIDDVAEKYFMAGGKKTELNKDVLDNSRININLVEGSNDIIAFIDNLVDTGNFPEGINSLLGGIQEGFTEKLALLSLKK